MISTIIIQIFGMIGWMMLTSFCWFLLTVLMEVIDSSIGRCLTPFLTALFIFTAMFYSKAGGLKVLIIAILATILMMLITSHWHHRVLFYKTLIKEKTEYTQTLEKELQNLKSTSRRL